MHTNWNFAMDFCGKCTRFVYETIYGVHSRLTLEFWRKFVSNVDLYGWKCRNDDTFGFQESCTLSKNIILCDFVSSSVVLYLLYALLWVNSRQLPNVKIDPSDFHTRWTEEYKKKTHVIN